MVLLQLALFSVLAGGLAITRGFGPLTGRSAPSNPISNIFQPPQPEGYLLVVASEVDYYQWTEGTDHKLSGTYQAAYIESHNTVQTLGGPLARTLDGTNITLTYTAGGYLQSLSGTLNGVTLTLTVTDSAGCLFNDVLHRATIQEYNTEVNTLRQRAARGQDPYVASTPCP
jgi:hypothetical protein